MTTLGQNRVHARYPTPGSQLSVSLPASRLGVCRLPGLAAWHLPRRGLSNGSWVHYPALPCPTVPCPGYTTGYTTLLYTTGTPPGYTTLLHLGFLGFLGFFWLPWATLPYFRPGSSGTSLSEEVDARNRAWRGRSSARRIPITES